MAKDQKSRLAEIYKSEKQKGGGVLSSIGKRGLEKFDPRQIFNQQGILAEAFPKLFKSYSATKSKSAVTSGDTSLSSEKFSKISDNIEFMSDKIADIKVDSKIIAKNSLVLPRMAMDTNIMRQNISKVVKLLGGEATKKTDMFFQNAAAREKDYESKFSKEKSMQSGRASAGASGKKDGGEGGGFLSKILGSAAKGLGKGIGLASMGAGIAGFLVAIGGAAWAIKAMGGAGNIKDLLVNLGEGLSAFTGTGIAMLAGLIASGALFGKMGAGTAVVGGIAAVGAGLAAFVGEMGVVSGILQTFGGAEAMKDVLVSLAEGLGAFSGQSMVALGSLLAAGVLFGVTGTGGAAIGGIAAMGAGLGAFLIAISGAAKIITMFGGHEALRDFLVNFAEGLGSFNQIDGGNLLKVTGAIAALGPALALFFGGKGIGSVLDFIGTGFDKMKSLIFGDGKSKSLIESLVEQLKPIEKLDTVAIKNLGDGLYNMASGLRGLAAISDKDMEKIQRATQVAKSVAVGTGTAPAAKPTATAATTTQAPVSTAPAPTKPMASTAPSKPSTPTVSGGSASAPGYISKAADLIMKEEGLPKGGKAYWDPAGQRSLVSVGYGHQIKDQEYRQGFIQAGNERIPIVGERGINTTLSKDQAKKLLEMDLPKYEAAASGPLGEAWNKLDDTQKASMISYAYNTGSTRSLMKHGFKEAVMSGNFQEAGKIISEKGIRTAGGTQNAALVKRRGDEGAMFASSPSISGTQLASASTNVSDGKMQLASAQPVVINTTSNSGGGRSSADNNNRYSNRTGNVIDRDMLGILTDRATYVL